MFFVRFFVLFFLWNQSILAAPEEDDWFSPSKDTRKKTKIKQQERKYGKRAKPSRSNTNDFSLTDLSYLDELRDEDEFKKVKEYQSYMKRLSDKRMEATFYAKKGDFKKQRELNEEILNTSSDARMIANSSFEILKDNAHKEHLRIKSRIEKEKSHSRKTLWKEYNSLHEIHLDMEKFGLENILLLSHDNKKNLKKAQVKILQYKISSLLGLLDDKTDTWEKAKEFNQKILEIDPENIKAKVGILIDEIRQCHIKNDFSNKKSAVLAILDLTPEDPHTKAKYLRDLAYHAFAFDDLSLGLFFLKEAISIPGLDDELISSLNSKIKKFSSKESHHSTT
jgi:hypothetical protein